MARITKCSECGWEGGPYRTSGAAAVAAHHHTCEGYRKRKERAERVTARRADPGVKRECFHRYARHQHGTHAAYALDRCRCRPCKDAQNEYNARRERLQLYGRWTPYVDAEPVRAHIRALGEQGMGWKRVAKEAGISSGAMSKLLWGVQGKAQSRRVRKETAQAILAVQLQIAGGANVPIVGTRRRLEGLVALGFPQAYLARRLGMLPSNLGSMLQRQQVVKSTADAVIALYKELSTATPESHGVTKVGTSRARNYGEKHGWVVPALWEDDELDDPDATPWTPEESGKRDENAALVENVEFLVKTGVTPAAALKRLGYDKLDSLAQALRRAKRSDLFKALKANEDQTLFR